jgi:hypothetical protein
MSLAHDMSGGACHEDTESDIASDGKEDELDSSGGDPEIQSAADALENNQVLIDLRKVLPEDEEMIVDALGGLGASAH